MTASDLRTERKNLLFQGSGTYFAVVFFFTFTISKLFNIAFNKIFTNVLPQSEMGQYTLILAATVTILTYATLGFPSALSRYTITYKVKGKIDQLKNMVFSGFILFIIAEFIIIIALVIFYFALNYTPNFLNIEPYISTLFLVGGIAIAQFFSTICFAIASALQNSRYYAIPIIMRALLQIPFGVIFVIYLNQGVFGLVLGLMCSEILVAIYSGYVLLKDLGIGKFSFSEIKSFLKYSSPGYANGIFVSSFNLFVLSYIEYSFTTAGKVILANYQYGAFSIVNLLMILGSIFRVVYPPVLYKNFEKERHSEMRNLTINISKLLAVIVITMSFFIYGFSHYLIVFFSQSAYLAGIPVIPLLLVAAFFELMQPIMTYGHNLYYKTYWQAIGGISSIAISTVAAIFVLPKYGLIGIGIVYVLFKGLNFTFMFIVSQKYFKVDYSIKLLLRLIIATAISIGMGLIFYFLVFNLEYRFNLLLSFSLGGVIFLILVLIFRLFTKKDIQFVKSLVTTFKDIRNAM